MLFLVLVILAGVSCGPDPAPPVPTPTATAVVSQPLAATDPYVRGKDPTPVVVATSTRPASTLAATEIKPSAEATPLVDATSAALPTAEALPSLYTVEAGDTLLGIAMQFDLPIAAIQLENSLGASTIVRVGDVLQIPSPGSWVEASPFWAVYEVMPGDTLSEIAAEYGLTLDALLTVNGSIDADMLAVGQGLVLPVNSPVELLVQRSAPEPAAPTVASSPPPEPTDVVVIAAAEAEPPPPEPTAANPDPAPEPEVAPTPVPPSEPPPAEVGALATEIFRLLNEQRAAYGLPPLIWNDILARTAQRHADDCYARGWCSHTGSDGSHYRERMIREGYEPLRWSECWAWYDSPERAVAMWMDEVPPNDAHRRTILSDYLTEVGVSVVPGNGRGYYFIADFGTPRQ